MIKAMLDEDHTTNNRTEVDYEILRRTRIDDFDIDPRKDSLETIRELTKIRSNPLYQTVSVARHKKRVEQYITVRGIDRRNAGDSIDTIDNNSNGNGNRSILLSSRVDCVSQCIFIHPDTIQKIIMANSINTNIYEFDHFYFVIPPFMQMPNPNLNDTIREIYSCIETRENFIEYVMNSPHHTNLELRKDLFEKNTNSQETFEYLGDMGWGIRTFGDSKIKDSSIIEEVQENGTQRSLIVHHFHYYGVDTLCNDNICKLQELKKTPSITRKDSTAPNNVQITKMGPEFLPLVDTNCLFGLILVIDAEDMSIVVRFFVPNWIFIRDLLNKSS
jgi:hypothetical protein